MVKHTIGLRLQDRLGLEATEDLSQAFEQVQNQMLTIATERFDGRLNAVGSELRQEMARLDSGIRAVLIEGLAKIRTDQSESRVEVLRWSFFFWIGQFAATMALIALLLRLASR
jgi:hypothetical protein